MWRCEVGPVRYREPEDCDIIVLWEVTSVSEKHITSTPMVKYAVYFFWNAGNYLQKYMTSQGRTPWSPTPKHLSTRSWPTMYYYETWQNKIFVC
jgi:hypothetical protein